MEITIRPARREDLPRVNEVRRQVNDVHVEGRPDIFRAGWNEALQSHVYEAFDDANCDVIVALAGDTLCGFATVQLIRRPETPYSLARDFYRVEEFGVDEAHRRMGVATALVEYMKRDAVKRGLGRLELDVWAFNRGALAFYEAAGFTTYRHYMEMDLDPSGEA